MKSESGRSLSSVVDGYLIAVAKRPPSSCISILSLCHDQRVTLFACHKVISVADLWMPNGSPFWTSCTCSYKLDFPHRASSKEHISGTRGQVVYLYAIIIAFSSDYLPLWHTGLLQAVEVLVLAAQVVCVVVLIALLCKSLNCEAYMFILGHFFSL